MMKWAHIIALFYSISSILSLPMQWNDPMHYDDQSPTLQFGANAYGVAPPNTLQLIDYQNNLQNMEYAGSTVDNLVNNGIIPPGAIVNQGFSADELLECMAPWHGNHPFPWVLQCWPGKFLYVSNILYDKFGIVVYGYPEQGFAPILFNSIPFPPPPDGGHGTGAAYMTADHTIPYTPQNTWPYAEEPVPVPGYTGPYTIPPPITPIWQQQYLPEPISPGVSATNMENLSNGESSPSSPRAFTGLDSGKRVFDASKANFDDELLGYSSDSSVGIDRSWKNILTASRLPKTKSKSGYSSEVGLSEFDLSPIDPEMLAQGLAALEASTDGQVLQSSKAAVTGENPRSVQEETVERERDDGNVAMESIAQKVAEERLVHRGDTEEALAASDLQRSVFSKEPETTEQKNDEKSTSPKNDAEEPAAQRSFDKVDGPEEKMDQNTNAEVVNLSQEIVGENGDVKHNDGASLFAEEPGIYSSNSNGAAERVETSGAITPVGPISENGVEAAISQPAAEPESLPFVDTNSSDADDDEFFDALSHLDEKEPISGLAANAKRNYALKDYDDDEFHDAADSQPDVANVYDLRHEAMEESHINSQELQKEVQQRNALRQTSLKEGPGTKSGNAKEKGGAVTKTRKRDGNKIMASEKETEALFETHMKEAAAEKLAWQNELFDELYAQIDVPPDIKALIDRESISPMLFARGPGKKLNHWHILANTHAMWLPISEANFKAFRAKFFSLLGRIQIKGVKFEDDGEGQMRPVASDANYAVLSVELLNECYREVLSLAVYFAFKKDNWLNIKQHVKNLHPLLVSRMDALVLSEEILSKRLENLRSFLLASHKKSK